MARSPLAVLVTALVTSAASVAACGGGSSHSSSPSGPSASAPSAPSAPGSGIDRTDEAYCAADAQRAARCASSSPSYGEDERRRCLERSCQLRTIHGAQVGDAIKSCLLQRPCGAHSHDPCYTMVLGGRASSPEARQAYAKCAPFEQRCGSIQGGTGKSVQCTYVALLGGAVAARVASCLDLECGLGQACVAGAIVTALSSCKLPHAP